MIESSIVPSIGVYYREHARCPVCLHHCYCHQRGDLVSISLLECVDRNAADCMQDSCGWRGTVHDMVPIWIHTMEDMVKIKKAKASNGPSHDHG
jgi:hypothetical protein